MQKVFFATETFFSSLQIFPFIIQTHILLLNLMFVGPFLNSNSKVLNEIICIDLSINLTNYAQMYNESINTSMQSFYDISLSLLFVCLNGRLLGQRKGDILSLGICLRSWVVVDSNAPFLGTEQTILPPRQVQS